MILSPGRARRPSTTSSRSGPATLAALAGPGALASTAAVAGASAAAVRPAADAAEAAPDSSRRRRVQVPMMSSPSCHGRGRWRRVRSPRPWRSSRFSTAAGGHGGIPRARGVPPPAGGEGMMRCGARYAPTACAAACALRRHPARPCPLAPGPTPRPPSARAQGGGWRVHPLETAPHPAVSLGPRLVSLGTGLAPGTEPWEGAWGEAQVVLRASCAPCSLLLCALLIAPCGAGLSRPVVPGARRVSARRRRKRCQRHRTVSGRRRA